MLINLIMLLSFFDANHAPLIVSKKVSAPVYHSVQTET